MVARFGTEIRGHRPGPNPVETSDQETALHTLSTYVLVDMHTARARTIGVLESTERP